MVCMVEVSQRMLKLLHRPLLLLEEALGMPCVEPACSVGAGSVGGSNACLLALELVSIEGCFGSADNGGRGG